ncbi:hypothetical protein [Umezawaea beigongshangensis]|uniref:hypothetical protein n=1 Tax=Umezawaea beigongshangensis TaxID=2780383 RepID=UPI0018F169F1|nr:hypothetical protein [Umezawaea beigongshangensis]
MNVVSSVHPVPKRRLTAALWTVAILGTAAPVGALTSPGIAVATAAGLAVPALVVRSLIRAANTCDTILTEELGPRRGRHRSG